MPEDPVNACVAAFLQAGWHVAPAAGPWPVTTEIHADRWWSPQLVDTAVLSLDTGHGVAQRVQIGQPQGASHPQHQVLAHTGPVPLVDLPAVVADWPAPGPAGPTPGEAQPTPPAQ